ncbi:hypothetical protein DH86_00002733, partial [Scytalidium sp. 3C]
KAEEVSLLPLEQEELIGRRSEDSLSSVSTTSLVFERIGERVEADEKNAVRASRNGQNNRSEYRSKRDSITYADNADGREDFDEENDDNLEDGPFLRDRVGKPANKKYMRWALIVGGLLLAVWVTAFAVYIGQKAWKHSSTKPHDPLATASRGSGKKVTLEEVMSGEWRATRQHMNWIEGANGEDGLLLEQSAPGKDYLVVEDVRGTNSDEGTAAASTTLMKQSSFVVGGTMHYPNRVYPSKDLKKVLVATDAQSNWRHSFYAKYWIFDVATQTAEALDPANPDGRIQLASWSPQSDAAVFTRDNNMFLRRLSESKVTQITTDGGTELFYGVPDWVYEEEVFGGNSATWWAEDGKYIAFLRTNETLVPEYPIQYFVSRPSGKMPAPGEENYPEVREIKYPKAGAPNPTVDLQFYDVEKGDVFEVEISGGFDADDLLITEVVWAGSTGKALIRESNRESDVLRVVLVDVVTRTGQAVRTTDVQKIDGGWFEISENTHGAGYALVTYNGPNIPWQKVISTPSNPNSYSKTVETNDVLAEFAKKHELPIEVYSTVNVDGYDLNVVERRPPHFDSKKKYPVLFYLYGGPGSQMVNKAFGVDFQSYIASSLGYIVVTVDGRGTGFIGRKARVIVRGELGKYEAHDQIATAKIWAQKSYVDASRLAIWGWSFGGFMTLKTLEQDAGQTFKYGMSVAPVTDWRFYDSIYTERYMHTPQHNPGGYDRTAISNVTALQQNVRFLIMHGVADDNVHMQNTLTLLDKLDLAGVENYDVHVFPDSDHGIYFHNANRIVYDKLSNWLINAFNGEWLKTANAVPLKLDGSS